MNQKTDARRVAWADSKKKTLINKLLCYCACHIQYKNNCQRVSAKQRTRFRQKPDVTTRVGSQRSHKRADSKSRVRTTVQNERRLALWKTCGKKYYINNLFITDQNHIVWYRYNIMIWTWSLWKTAFWDHFCFKIFI